MPLKGVIYQPWSIKTSIIISLNLIGFQLLSTHGVYAPGFCDIDFCPTEGFYAACLRDLDLWPTDPKTNND